MRNEERFSYHNYFSYFSCLWNRRPFNPLTLCWLWDRVSLDPIPQLVSRQFILSHMPSNSIPILLPPPYTCDQLTYQDVFGRCKEAGDVRGIPSSHSQNGQSLYTQHLISALSLGHRNCEAQCMKKSNKDRSMSLSLLCTLTAIH